MSRSFESVQWNTYVHGLDLSLYSHPKEFGGRGEWVWIHVNSKGKKTLYRKNSTQRIKPKILHQAGQPNTLPTSYSGPHRTPWKWIIGSLGSCHHKSCFFTLTVHPRDRYQTVEVPVIIWSTHTLQGTPQLFLMSGPRTLQRVCRDIHFQSQPITNLWYLQKNSKLWCTGMSTTIVYAVLIMSAAVFCLSDHNTIIGNQMQLPL